MSTLHSLIVMLIMFGLGFIPIMFVAPLVGLAGMPGLILHTSSNRLIRLIGALLMVTGICYTAGAYSVFVIGFLRWYAEWRGGLPSWPLVIAAFTHMTASVYMYLSITEKESASNEPAIIKLARFVFWITLIIFGYAVSHPALLDPIYGWVPFSGSGMP